MLSALLFIIKSDNPQQNDYNNGCKRNKHLFIVSGLNYFEYKLQIGKL